MTRTLTLDVSFCLDALEEALTAFGLPAIFNTDCEYIGTRPLKVA